MLVICDSCGTTFKIDKKLLGICGRFVRCSVCEHEWLISDQSSAENLSDISSDIKLSQGIFESSAKPKNAILKKICSKK
ncbi:MAG: zinc-ribbon domain-containing protein, partial [Proteobacteria bacterium]|nr:zinc-ribbon domain-containing protein [Pseudomonadota bacterium]